ncbi:DUF1802 family protein [Paenibacillus koleovorans]|uniref:DUF1802 family protein n=1 Tax=Paenibacillus koleovorans TaxID=121608 RepID=UPI000FD842CD|nr:DUF1802 family protein [Paenibacillus koleovorans]
MAIIAEEQKAALKEWAVAVEALLEGSQILIMRKGGIIEETRHFELVTDSFYFYPTYEHQKKRLLKEEYQDRLDRTLVGWTPEDKSVTIRAYAEAVEDIEVFSQEELNRLRELHIWTDEFSSERLHWKKTQPLHVILLRVYKLVEPIEADIREEYIGCKSWLELQSPLPAGVQAEPVLSDEEFERRCMEVKEALGRV